jgi:hypothetical protein
MNVASEGPSRYAGTTQEEQDMIRLNGLKAALVLVASIALASCAEAPVEQKALEPLGDFKLGYAVVSAKNAEIAPLSREATPEEWETAIKSRLEARLAPLQGSRYYHVSITVGAYALAVPGIPIVASPKSAIVILVNLWDDAEQKILLEPAHKITVIEAITAKSIFGSGLTQTREEQLAYLADRAVEETLKYLRENEAVFHRFDAQSET